MALAVISGCPGSGKTTLARSLARESPQGVHLETYTFYRFLAHPVDPSTPEAHQQNRTVIRAYTRAAVAFAEGGYEVYLEGIVGPWMLDIVVGEAGEAAVEYVLLHASLYRALERCAARGRQSSATPEIVRKMHCLFADPGPLGRHLIDTTNLAPVEVVAEYRRRRDAGDLLLRT